MGGFLREKHGIGSTVHWGNDGFMIDAALTHPLMPEDVTLGVMTDFNRYRNTPDPIDWELFRTDVLRSQGWQIERVWSPGIYRDLGSELSAISGKHRRTMEGEVVREKVELKQRRGEERNPSND